MYSEKELQESLNTKIFGKKIYVYDNIESTNLLAKKVASLGADEGTVIITEFQTAGRGRLGRAWVGDPATNLLMSIIIRPKIDNTKIGLLPLYTAVGAAFTIEALTGLKCECKWPNDILLNGRKCCGILLESAFQADKLAYAVIGIGLNINQQYFGEELDKKATSLLNESGKYFQIKDVFSHLMRSMESLYTDVQNGYFNSIIREWKLRSNIFGREIIVIENEKEIACTALDIANDGGLMVKTQNGYHTFYAGDVTIKKRL